MSYLDKISTYILFDRVSIIAIYRNEKDKKRGVLSILYTVKNILCPNYNFKPSNGKPSRTIIKENLVEF